MHAIQDVSPRSTLLGRITAPLRRMAAALRHRPPTQNGKPFARVFASVPGSGPGTLLTMRGPDGVPFRCVEIGGAIGASAPHGAEAQSVEQARRSA